MIRENYHFALTAVIALALCAGCGKKDADGTISATGTIEAIEVTVSARVGATVEQVRVDEGDLVKTGDTLILQDPAYIRLQLTQAEAAAEMAAAQLALVEHGAREEDRTQAEQQLVQANTALAAAETDAGRMDELFASGSISLKQKEDVHTRLEIARAQHEAAAQAVKKVNNIARPEEIRAARARLKQARAARDLAARQLDDCVTVAPVAGLVTGVLKEQGELAGAGTPLTVISDNRQVELMIYVPETDLGRIAIGDKAEVFIDTRPDAGFTGTVTYISPTAEFTPKNIQTKEDRVKLVFGVKIAVPNPDGILKAGMPADAVIKQLTTGN